MPATLIPPGRWRMWWSRACCVSWTVRCRYRPGLGSASPWSATRWRGCTSSTSAAVSGGVTTSARCERSTRSGVPTARGGEAAVIRHGVFLYPWDVVGDPGAAERIAALGVDSVSLAASYHTVRAITPWHPRHRVLEAAHAAAYYRIREPSWAGKRLRPARPGWMADPDSFGSALAALLSVGLEVNAWVVLTHNSYLGRRNLDLTVRNSFGDRYSYALCPSHAAVREYVTTVVGEIADQYPVAALELEACGWLGFEHNGHH